MLLALSHVCQVWSRRQAASLLPPSTLLCAAIHASQRLYAHTSNPVRHVLGSADPHHRGNALTLTRTHFPGRRALAPRG